MGNLLNDRGLARCLPTLLSIKPTTTVDGRSCVVNDVIKSIYPRIACLSNRCDSLLSHTHTLKIKTFRKQWGKRRNIFIYFFLPVESTELELIRAYFGFREFDYSNFKCMHMHELQPITTWISQRIRKHRQYWQHRCRRKDMLINAVRCGAMGGCVRSAAASKINIYLLRSKNQNE